MRLNRFRVSTVLYFKSGNSKKVDWDEERLVKKVTLENREVTEGLTLDEANAFFQGKFKEWKDNGTTIVRKNIRGENSVIPFGEVEYATVVVTLLGDEVELPKPTLPPPPAPPPRSIADHPAFKK